ncbi:MAG: tRNA (N(6)-L-threonylcarbamoyladenosine(37)-C(2))-methylthiotransferase MtaB [Candidatus Omnitrophica bacterium]|nr:tRNA (N(6)-L-threonylcarbamoyladenosine(37)-C(2))-methylthiotransferase MtaB [Candidatus Omnitrophota bacterium]
MINQKNIAFYTFGCRLNQSETAVIEQCFEKRGYKIVPFKEPADVVVVNTCTVTENGDQDTRRLVNKINRINPNAKIALVGCQAQIQKEALTSLQNVHWVVGNARKMELAEIISKTSPTHEPQVITPTIPRDDFTIPIAGIDRHHTRANIKIQDGCDFFCSFCEIPYARGRARSRKFSDVLKEANELVQAGHKEIVITGINVGTYHQETKTILDVVEAMEQIHGLERIRISSIEPTTIPEKLIYKMAGHSKLCRHLHIPLQSGSNEILQSMKRKYLKSDFIDFIHFVKSTVPEVCIGTDIIVGFPGEDDQHFQDTHNILKDQPIDYAHVFSYSARHLAKSRHSESTVETHIIQRRSKILRDLSVLKRKRFFKQQLRKKVLVLFEQGDENVWKGTTDHYIKVSVKSQKDLQNKLLSVDLEAVHNNEMSGVLSYETNLD